MTDERTGRIAMEILIYMSNENVRLWLKQTDIPYCFLKFDPERKQITVCRWGLSRRPPGTNEIYWQRIKPSGDVSKGNTWNEILTVMKRWDRIWDNIVFNKFESTRTPDLLPNSRFSSYIPSVQTENIFQMRH